MSELWRRGSLSQSFLAVTVDLSRYGIPDGQIVVAGSGQAVSWNPLGPDSVSLGTFSDHRTLFNKRIDVRVGLLPANSEFVGTPIGAASTAACSARKARCSARAAWARWATRSQASTSPEPPTTRWASRARSTPAASSSSTATTRTACRNPPRATPARCSSTSWAIPGRRGSGHRRPGCAAAPCSTSRVAPSGTTPAVAPATTPPYGAQVIHRVHLNFGGQYVDNPAAITYTGSALDVIATTSIYF